MNRRLNLVLLACNLIIIAPACDETPAESKLKPTYAFLVGSYTSDTSEKGIGFLTFNHEEGTLAITTLEAQLSNPSFVIANRAQDIVYAVEENQEGTVKSFAFDRAKNQLTLLDEQSTLGAHPCYLALSPDEQFLVVGNYTGGNFTAFRVEKGKMKHVQTIQHEGSSIHAARQNQSHVHSTVFHTAGKQLLVGDLGADKLFIYNYRPDFNLPFQAQGIGYFELNAGAGPRHLVIHPNGRWVYVVHELSGELGAYILNEGKLENMAQYPLTESTFIGAVGAAEVKFSPDNRFLYVSNRGDANELISFKLSDDGSLSLVERIASGGSTPRSFTLTKDGKFLLVAHQGSDDIQVFERNLQNGQLTKKNIIVKSTSPVYLFALDG
jgi:6-phosphogluconolactonase